MSHGFDAATAPAETRATEEERIPSALGVLDRALQLLNRVVLDLGGACLVAACLVLSHSVLIRHVFKEPTEWQDEMTVFLIVGATFGSAAAVQAKRGHVAIEALTGLLSPTVNRARLLLADFVSFVFVAFFTWKSFSLLHEAWVDGQISQSTWGAPLWIPYSMMAAGMTLLGVQLALQILKAALHGPSHAGWAAPKVGVAADVNRDMQNRPDPISGGLDGLASPTKGGQ